MAVTNNEKTFISMPKLYKVSLIIYYRLFSYYQSVILLRHGVTLVQKRPNMVVLPAALAGRTQLHKVQESL